jgi:hypothetical protein
MQATMYFTTNEVVDRQLIPVNQVHNLNTFLAALESNEEMQAVYPTYIRHQFTNRDGHYTYEQSRIYLMHPMRPETVIYAIADGFNSKWSFRLDNEQVLKLRNLTNGEVGGAYKQFDAPQNVNVLSRKKVEAWIDYLVKVHSYMRTKNDEKGETVDAFKRKLEGLDVYWSSETTGRINSKYFDYNFRIVDGYVDETVKYKGGNKLDDFLKVTGEHINA